MNAFEDNARTRFSGFKELLMAFTPIQRMLLYIFGILVGLSAFILLAQANNRISVQIPASGGSFIEGAVGTPRFINPLLAVSQTDQDLMTLVYSGLVREEKHGTFIPDLAERFEISPDGTTYTFHLRNDRTFHDGHPLTAQDVLFTVLLAQNPDAKSTRRADWEGVQASAPDDHTVVFTLPSAYAPFMENATMGILPKHMWENIPVTEFQFASLNTHPIGSGPYRIRDVSLDATGAPISYDLIAFKNFALGEPHITHMTYRIFANEEELRDSAEDIDSYISNSPKSLARTSADDAQLIRAPLSRVFGVFLNQNHAPVLANAAVRQALDAAVDKEKIVQDVLGGYGKVLHGPIPAGIFATSTGVARTSITDHAAAAREILAHGGWKFDESAGAWTKDKATLSVKIATADTEELVATARAVADNWKAAGIQADVEVYPLSEFNQTILRPRTYDAILFGEVIGTPIDLFPFWHSSQRNDPGLNLSLYTNAVADKALLSARSETDPTLRDAANLAFVQAVAEDMPAVFLYTPEIVYLAPEFLHGIEIGTITTPAERFTHVYTWYRDMERVWEMFMNR